MIPRWVSPYVGIAYEVTNCWALVRQIYAERWGITLPNWSVDRQGLPIATILADGPAWMEVSPEAAQLGDLVAITQSGMVRHVGLVVAPGMMLHSEEGLDSVIESYRGIVYRARLGGIYRHPDF